ncbi:MAG: EamA family transporter RarD, partial [Proteobacteria bacterium]|nr:EamA family transporter RarD [Pseudomonadota bacterium]
MPTTHKAPLFYAIAAYVAWGGFPLFWRFLQAIPALEVVSHRVVWSALFLSLLLWQRGLWPAWRHSLRPGKHRIYFLVSSLLISSNWLIYVWAVNAKHVLETSLGYFINPLLSIALGVLIFRERLRPVQYLCLGLACLGVIIMSFQAHHFPWIALGLAGTFGGYGLLRKKMDVDSLVANQIDAMLIAIPALFYIGWQLATGQSTA